MTEVGKLKKEIEELKALLATLTLTLSLTLTLTLTLALALTLTCRRVSPWVLPPAKGT